MRPCAPLLATSAPVARSGGMGYARYFVFPLASDWLVVLEGRVMARHNAREPALSRAIIMADLMGAMHHEADVMLETGDGRPLELTWSYGRDVLPASNVGGAR